MRLMSPKPIKRCWFVWRYKTDVIYITAPSDSIQRKDLDSCLMCFFFFFSTFMSWSFFHLSRSTFCFSFQLHISVPVQEGPQADPVKVPLTDFQAAKLKLKTIPIALCTVCFVWNTPTHTFTLVPFICLERINRYNQGVVSLSVFTIYSLKFDFQSNIQ